MNNPRTTALFLGGPRDGRFIAVNGYRDVYEVPVMRPLSPVDPPPEARTGDTVVAQTITYRRHEFRDTNGRALDLFLTEDVEKFGAMQYLIAKALGEEPL